MSGCGGEPGTAAAVARAPSPPMFREVAAQLGIDFRHEAEVTWPGGDTERFSIDGVDRAVVLARGEGTR